jgi:cathepsin F
VKHIVKATKQVVSGMRYIIKTVLISDDNEIECEFDVWEQVWIENGREVTVTCKNDKEYKLIQNPVNKRPKRETLVGAPIETDDHNDVKKLLTEHLKRLDTGSAAPLELVEIKSVTQQVVAGIKYIVKGTYKIGDEQKKCTVEVWHRAWIKGNEGTQLNAQCDEGVSYKERALRKKRSAHHHHRQLADHYNDHHHHHDRHHHYSATEQMKEVKSEILFDNFIEKYNRKYANDLEHKMRMRTFKKNLHKIEMLNKNEQGTAKYGITEFADMTEKEYLHRTGLLIPQRHDNDLGNPIAQIPDIEDLPTEFDWREKSAVTDVKNQGNCGSCWSFSVTGNIEGLHAIKTGKLEAYSEQELLDCDTTDNACNGK